MELSTLILILVVYLIGFYSKDLSGANTWEAKVKDIFFYGRSKEQNEILFNLCDLEREKEQKIAEILRKRKEEIAAKGIPGPPKLKTHIHITVDSAKDTYEEFLKNFPKVLQERSLKISEVMSTDAHWKLRNYLVDDFGSKFPKMAKDVDTDYKTWWRKLDPKEKIIFGYWARTSLKKDLV